MKTSHLVNMVLQKSFDDNAPINSMKLQKIIFLVAKLYKDVYGENLLEESFLTWGYGPVLLSVHEFYKPLNGSSIEKFMKDFNNKAFVSTDANVQEIVDSMWRETCGLNTKDTAELTRVEGMGWFEAYMNNSETIEF